MRTSTALSHCSDYLCTQIHSRGPENLKRSIYFDPEGFRASAVTVPVVDSLFSSDQFVVLESLDPFSRGPGAIRGCKVCIADQQRQNFYLVFTKYRKKAINFAIKGESDGQETWGGPLLVMRLDKLTATRIVSISNKAHKDSAIKAAARYVPPPMNSYEAHVSVFKVRCGDECDDPIHVHEGQTNPVANPVVKLVDPIHGLYYTLPPAYFVVSIPAIRSMTLPLFIDLGNITLCRWLCSDHLCRTPTDP